MPTHFKHTPLKFLTNKLYPKKIMIGNYLMNNFPPTNFDDEIILKDYRLAYRSRQMSAMARQEVLNGRAKWGWQRAAFGGVGAPV